MNKLFSFFKHSIFPKKESPFLKVDAFHTIGFLPTMALEQQIVTQNISAVSAWCSVCNDARTMTISTAFVDAIKNGGFINWREDAICQVCHFNARTRATVDLVNLLFSKKKIQSAYITEAVTPLFFRLKEKINGLVGSEYLGGDKVGGQLYACQGQLIRHEDVTRLSFSDNELDLLLSFDVLEHVSDYKLALTEIYRTLKQGGHALLTTPINPRLKSTVTRAYVDSVDLQVKHLLEPVYHGDPINNSGILCFHDFGIDIVDILYLIGFSKVDVFIAQSKNRYYLGDFHIFLYLTK
ncbi:class I SAM-dependent methyltransferase [Beggiatoa alba]|nr:class I SAM-dependent methyltransferase [Beggiatoa alba]